MAEEEKKKKKEREGGVMSLNDRHYRLLKGLSSSAKPSTTTTTSNTLAVDHHDDDAPHFSLCSDDSPSPPTHHPTHEKTVLKKSENEDLPTDVTEEEYAEEEKKLVKVKVHGRRRLCKVSFLDSNSHDIDRRSSITPTNDPYLADFDSPSPPQKDKDTGSGEDIRDILNDLSSRLDLLSIERKPAPRFVDSRKVPLPSVVDENVDLLYSPPCSLSAVSDPSSDASYRSAREDELVSKYGDLHREEHNEEPIKVVKKPVRRTFAPTDEDFDDEDDECMIMGVNKMVKKAEYSQDKFHERFDYFDETDILDIYSDDDEVPEDESSIIMTSSTSKYVLPGKTATMLFPHQRDGLKWLWSLHTQGKGGILGDDMGLGKTMQMCGFLAGMFHSNLIKRALIVAPKTLLPHWIKELSAVGLSEKTRGYFGTCTKTRQYELQYVLQDKGVLLTTYDIVRNNTKALRGVQYVDNEDDIMWDYMILDEGHLIKNPGTQRAKSLLEIPSAHRIIISGTPIQNNLKELWALFNFCCPELLGVNKWFKEKYESPILRGNDKNASDREKRIGSAVAKELREHIEPYFLRRLKSDVFRDDDSKEAAKLSKKNEIIVWLKLTSTQRQLYKAFLKSELVLSAFDGSPLAALTILKKICDHPLLLTKRAAEDLLEGMDIMLNPEEKVDAEKLAMHLADMTERSDFEGNHDNVSCKISFILSLLDHLIPEGHCTLIFSQTRKMLNLIQDSLVARCYKFLRIDGTTKACDRVQVVNDFQEGVGAPIFLLTSQVGGLGLTLTKADRVIVVDPAWNPSTDNQSVDRAYRIGQKKDVVVYRLMTCGTIEEKIYRKQIYKGGLFKTATEHKEQTRYFSQQDLQELFSLPKLGFDVSPTQQQLLEEHDSQHKMSEYLKAHVQFLETQGIAGVSQHSLLFSKTAPVPKPQDDDVVSSHNETTFMGNNSSSTSRIEFDVDDSKYAFNPKDVIKQNKRNPSKDSTHKRTEFEVNDRIARLSKMLVDKVLVSRLPDKGDNIRKQLAEMKTELDVLQRARKTENDVICLDDISEDFQRVLNV